MSKSGRLNGATSPYYSQRSSTARSYVTYRDSKFSILTLLVNLYQFHFQLISEVTALVCLRMKTHCFVNVRIASSYRRDIWDHSSVDPPYFYRSLFDLSIDGFICVYAAPASTSTQVRLRAIFSTFVLSVPRIPTCRYHIHRG